MPASLHTSFPPAPTVHSQVFREPLAPLVGGALLLGLALLVLPTGVVMWPHQQLTGAALVLIGVLLLGAAGYLATRGSTPLLLILDPVALHLASLGRSGGLPPGLATIPLTSIAGYRHWRSRGRVLTRCYLRLTLTDGRVLSLAEPPGGLPAPGTVPLPALIEQLARQLGPPTR